MILHGKRLLLLGGTPLMCHVVQKAKEMGVYTIVTDYYGTDRAPAKLIADEAYDISTLDVEGLINLAKECKVDGVFTGYSDITLAPCRKVCDVLGFPFYATLDQLEKTLNKRKFKACCRAHGIRVVEDIDPVLISTQPEQIQFPVIVKPVDSYSSKGISVCHDVEMLRKGINTALSFSSCKEVLVEEYITADDVYIYLTIQDGMLSLSAMADRLLNDEQFGFAPQPVGYFFPSRYIDKYYEQIHDNLQNMIKTLGFKNGTFFVQGFVKDEYILLFEMGIRLSGGAGYLSITHQNGIDPVKMHINYALTGEFSGWDVKVYDNPYFEKLHCVVVVLLKNGTIGKIYGWSDIKTHPAVFDTIKLLHEGDVLIQAGTLNQVFARIYISAESLENLKQAISEVQTVLKIQDINGRDMVLNSFAVNSAFK